MNLRQIKSALPNAISRPLVVIALFASFGCSGQSAEAPPPVDTLYAVRNAVKFDPVRIVFGDYRLLYERILSDRWSVEGGVGITRRNYASGWFDYDLDNLGTQVDIRTGLALSLYVRRYFRADPELIGPYLAAGFSFLDYRKDYHPLDRTGQFTDAALTDRRRYSSAVLLFGIQPLSYASNVFVDFHTGPALRFKDFDQVRATDPADPATYHIRAFTEATFGWEVGVRLGFGF